MKITQFRLRIIKIWKSYNFIRELWKAWKPLNSTINNETNENHRIPLENHEIIENLWIPIENQENHENLRILLSSYENHANLRSPYENLEIH